MSEMTFRKRPRAAFISNEGGNTAMIFGLGFVPVMLMLGATSDYTQFATKRSQLQQATDAAVLKVATHPEMSAGNMTAAQAKDRLQVQLNARPEMATATVKTTTISQDKQTICATTSVIVKNSFMQLAQLPTLTANANTCANLAWGVNPNTTYEIALVLDNSGSMNNGSPTKMSSLKSAAASFVNTMFSKAPGKVQFSVTPFAGAVVAVDPTVSSNRTLSWIDTQGNNSQHWTVFGGKTLANAAGFTDRFSIYDKLRTRNSQMDWRGCFEALTYPLNVQDTAVVASDPETRYVPYLAPDEPTNYLNNNYLDDGGGYTSGGSTIYSCTSSERAPTANWDRLIRPCKYKPTAARSGSYGPYDFYGPSAFCPDPTTQRILQLSNSQSTVTNKINQLVGNGNTNLHEGIMWGWRTISPVGPFALGRAYDALNNRKIMIFMTDGFNNWSAYRNTVGGSSYEALGYYSYNGQKNLRLPDGSSGNGVDYRTALAAAANKNSSYLSTSRAAQDELTLQACDNAKAQGIEIFTIGFSIPTDPIDAQGLNVMKECATNVDHYFAVENASQLNAAFATIGVGIGKLRLTQ